MWDGGPRSTDDPYWLETGRVWVEVAPGRKRLIHLDQPERPPVARSSFPAPAIRRDSIDPTRGPDGRMHESLSGYRRSLRADGNPQGENYIEIGNEELKPVEHKFDRKERREDIRAAIADVKAGRVPPPVALGD